MPRRPIRLPFETSESPSSLVSDEEEEEENDQLDCVADDNMPDAGDGHWWQWCVVAAHQRLAFGSATVLHSRSLRLIGSIVQL